MFRRIALVVMTAYTAMLGLMVVFIVVTMTLASGLRGCLVALALAVVYGVPCVLFVCHHRARRRGIKSQDQTDR